MVGNKDTVQRIIKDRSCFLKNNNKIDQPLVISSKNEIKNVKMNSIRNKKVDITVDSTVF